MVKQRLLLTVALLAGCAMAGCGSSGTGGASDQAGLAAQSAPDQVVAEFLEAVRVGDDKKAALLLTPLARQKTAEMEMVVAPPGSETAKYQVGAAQLVQTGARVASDWTDLDNDGREHTDHIMWLLRHDAEGWRIMGMSASVFADQGPIELNFEDPADMLRKQQAAEDELARRDRQARASGASQPSDEPAQVR